jgi:hypothetical protein
MTNPLRDEAERRLREHGVIHPYRDHKGNQLPDEYILFDNAISVAVQLAEEAVAAERERCANRLLHRAQDIQKANDGADESTPNWQWVAATLDGEADDLFALPLETEEP